MSVLVLCKFTPLGFETLSARDKFKFAYGVNLPRWGLKPISSIFSLIGYPCVNLPRWGLKQSRSIKSSRSRLCVNLPRWGLKPPLGFETRRGSRV